MSLLLKIKLMRRGRGRRLHLLLRIHPRSRLKHHLRLQQYDLCHPIRVDISHYPEHRVRRFVHLVCCPADWPAYHPVVLCSTEVLVLDVLRYVCDHRDLPESPLLLDNVQQIADPFVREQYLDADEYYRCVNAYEMILECILHAPRQLYATIVPQSPSVGCSAEGQSLPGDLEPCAPDLHRYRGDQSDPCHDDFQSVLLSTVQFWKSQWLWRSASWCAVANALCMDFMALELLGNFNTSCGFLGIVQLSTTPQTDDHPVLLRYQDTEFYASLHCACADLRANALIRKWLIALVLPCQQDHAACDAQVKPLSSPFCDLRSVFLSMRICNQLDDTADKYHGASDMIPWYAPRISTVGSFTLHALLVVLTELFQEPQVQIQRNYNVLLFNWFSGPRPSTRCIAHPWIPLVDRCVINAQALCTFNPPSIYIASSSSRSSSRPYSHALLCLTICSDIGDDRASVVAVSDSSTGAAAHDCVLLAPRSAMSSAPVPSRRTRADHNCHSRLHLAAYVYLYADGSLKLL